MKRLLLLVMLLLAALEVSAQTPSYYQIPPNSTGKRIPCWSATWSGILICEQTFTLFNTSGAEVGTPGSPLHVALASAMAATQSGVWTVGISGSVAVTGSLGRSWALSSGADSISAAVSNWLTTAGAPGSVRLSDGTVFYDGRVIRPLTSATDSITTVPSGTQAVSGPLTDAQMRAAAVPVSGPLTDAQVRASPVPVSVSGGASSANQTNGNQQTQIVDSATGAEVLPSAPGADTGQRALAVRVISQLGGGGSGGTVDQGASGVDPWPVTVSNPTADPATETTLAELSATLAALNAKVTAVNTGAVTVAASALPSNAAKETGGNLDDILAELLAMNAKIPALGQALAAASVPVVLPAAQITTLTPPAAITGFATSVKQDTAQAALDAIKTDVDKIPASPAQEGGNLAAIAASAASIDTKTPASPATAGNQTSTNTKLDSIITELGQKTEPADTQGTNLAQVAGGTTSTVATGVQKVAIADSAGTPLFPSQASLNYDASVIGGLLPAQLVAQFDNSSPGTITEDRFGNVRMSSNRNLFMTLRDGAGNERAANVNSSGQLSVVIDLTSSGALTSIDGKTPALVSGRVPVDGSGVTQPISAASLPLPASAATSTKQSDGSQKTQVVDAAGNVIGATANALDVNIKSGGSGDGALLDGASPGTKATVKSYTNANPLTVRLTDTNGDYVSAGGGTQYTEDAASASDPIGSQLLARRRDTLATETTTDGDVTALNSTGKGELYVKNVDPVPASQSGAWSMTVNAGTNLNTSNLALEAGNLATIAAKDFATQTTLALMKAKTDNIPPLGQALAAASTPVVLTAAQVTTLTPPTTVTVTQGTGSNLHTVVDSAPTTAVTNAGLTNIDVALSTRTKPSDQQHAIVDSGAVTVTNATAANLKAQVAQNASISTSATLQSAAVANGNGTVFTVDGMAAAVLTVNCSSCAGGTTINFEASEDASNYVAVQSIQIGTTTIASTTTTAGVTVWEIPVGGFTSLRSRISAYSAGTITVTGHAVPVAYNPKVTAANIIGTVPISAASGSVASGAIASGAVASGAVASGAFASGSISDGAVVTVGAKTDAKSTATDATSVTLMQVMKEISAMEQAPASRAVTNAGTFPVQAAGDVAHDAVDSGNPTKVGGQARTTLPTATSDADRANFITDKFGRVITLNAIPELVAQQYTSITGTSETTIVTAAGANVLANVWGIVITNTSATNTYVHIKDSTAGTTRLTLTAPANDTRGWSLPGIPLMQATANNNWTATANAAVSTLYITVIYTKDK